MKQAKVAVIGAGWAGLAAAASLADFAKVTLFEASQQAGGRARALNQNHPSFRSLDNGQHLLIGAYTETLRLLDLVGVEENEVFFRQPLTWHMMDGLQLSCPALPSPLHIIWGLLVAKNWQLIDKIQLLKNIGRLKKFPRQKSDDIPFSQWLHQQGVSTKEVKDFWQPLVMATMNTPLTVASTEILANVLKDGVLKKRQHSDFLIPKTDLGMAFVTPVLQWLKNKNVNICLGQRIKNIESNHSSKKVYLDNEYFDAVIVATAPYHVNDLLKTVYAPETRQALQKLNYSAITTVYLQYQARPNLPKIIQGFADGMAQWIVNRDALGLGKNEVAVVCSVTQESSLYGKQDWINAVHQEIMRIDDSLMQPLAAQVITEKRATIQAAYNRVAIPTLRLSHHQIYLAGDYMHPVYPATLEGAVQSGQHAAAMLLADWNSICQ